MADLMHVGQEIDGVVIHYDENPDFPNRYYNDGQRPMDIYDLLPEEMVLINLNCILNICRIASEDPYWRMG